MLEYFFPRSDLEKQWAHTEPAGFLVRIFLMEARFARILFGSLAA
jgi:hypothetical protein